MIGEDPVGPVAESVDARAVHRSLSWFKSRPGLQPSRLFSSNRITLCFDAFSSREPGSTSLENGTKCRLTGLLRPFRGCGIWSKDHPRARLIPSAGFEGRAVGAPFFCAQFPFPRDLMPKRTDISTILIIGAGPIVIGQACEFDYSGTQAVKTLKEEGFRIVLVNSNPATIMTDPELADATYIEPITPEIVAKIIEKERNVIPGGFALLPTMGGQTALNCALSLRRQGTLAKFDIEMIGATADAIDKAEDRQLFREAMSRIGLETPKSRLANASALKKSYRDKYLAE